MTALGSKTIERVQEFRTKYFLGVGKALAKVGFTANSITGLSLLFGIAAFFLFGYNHFLFVLAIIIHLLTDAVDGLVARATNTSSTFGDYFDHISDGFVGFLLLLKIAWVLNDYFAYIVAAIYFINQATHFISKRQLPAIFTRTFVSIGLLFYVPGIIGLTVYVPVLVYLVSGIFSVYSLVLQLQWFVKNVVRK
ncbi:CDP-alcohol phosphatidyltransferase family protein [Candidatus Woesearchaeota archaeon]|jgi:archaetidylinositol phosphate synthase|nr:CDP-alcohol phosphatidyltransferase family protein [Candidatus Woesearchaeota archaeon]MBT5397087.1 CDP-alcohol phosphatidyltransferase family protein [Candidatus Woesearchaeota archaeon]MBT6367367.1 CDP-alcohol phosphatidyltransferase family protein [Candidatus Woesearchaeota archaeon]MBT7762487.1 CDP-alcohol phosphatidyltransferase family protein [Candidatus Woesearchaeota archaeon]